MRQRWREERTGAEVRADGGDKGSGAHPGGPVPRENARLRRVTGGGRQDTRRVLPPLLLQSVWGGSSAQPEGRGEFSSWAGAEAS